jgi:hypothetical protein
VGDVQERDLGAMEPRKLDRQTQRAVGAGEKS